MRTGHSRIRTVRWAAVLTIGGLILSACFNREEPPVMVTATPSIVPSVASQMVKVTLSIAATLSPLPMPTAAGDFFVYTLSGIIYDTDVGLKQPMPEANVSWHFIAPDMQLFNGQTTADASGVYRIPLRVRVTDVLLITASASGYLPTAVRLQAKKFAANGTRLDFGLSKANGQLPALPGDVGPIKLNGLVYDANQGLNSPIASAIVQITTFSIVHPQIEYDRTTDSSGAFNTTIALLHSTDQIRIVAVATGYMTTTLIRPAKDMQSQTLLLVALQPAQ